MEKITVQQAKALIDNSVGSIYSKNDVLAILNRIDEPTQHSTAFEISDEMKEELVSRITEDVVESIEDCIDGYSFSMNYNEVQVDSIDVDGDRIEKMIKQAVDQWVDEMSDDDDCGC